MTNRWFGPGTLVAAAFLGPGTVTVCTLAGARFGYALLWTLVFSIVATLVLQEMAARLGWVSQSGLGAAIRSESPAGFSRYVFMAVVLAAILVGNAAYEAGNIGGAVLGVEDTFGASRAWPAGLGLMAFAALFLGRYALLEKALVGLVVIMSLCFLATAVLARPQWSELVRGLVPIAPPADSWLTAVALVGTTVVPYNLFLHSASVSEKWGPGARLSHVRWETAFAILLGGIISMGIVVTAAAAFHGRGATITSARDMAVQLEPLLGKHARLLLAFGLFAAGISSAITAPLAAAYAARGLFGWPDDWRDAKFRAVWMMVLATGVLFASLGLRPVLLIQFAQVANAIVLPVVAVFLLVLANRPSVMGDHCNRAWQNAAAVAVIAVTLILSVRGLNGVLGIW